MADPMRPDGPVHPGQPNAPRCTARRKDGQHCGQYAVRGTDKCRMHAGRKLSEHRARGELTQMMRSFGLGDSDIDPKDFALQLVAQSKARVMMLSELLGRAYEAADRLREAHMAQRLVEVGADDEGSVSAAELVARADLERIFNTGGVSALIGHTYTATQAGGIYATGEAIRGLAKLEAEERDRAASYAFKAVAAGIAQQQVDAVKKMGDQMALVFRAMLNDLDLTQEQWGRVPVAMSAHLALVAGSAA